jgi:hypothetical protein
MKKIFSTIIIGLAAVSFVNAQTEMDALKYLETDIVGTAR